MGARDGEGQPGLFDALGTPEGERAPERKKSARGKTGKTGQAAEEPAAAAPRGGTRSDEPAVVTVSELTREIAGRLKGLGRVAVEGEVSSLKRAGSGHVYFSLKDGEANLACAIWRSRVAGALRFGLEEGMRVVCHGAIDVYAPRGSYSLIVERVEQRGLGELLARLEEDKRRLREQGWFDRHRPLPALPACIGVVTSRDAAAFQDFLRTRSLRWPGYPVRLAHAPVQGRAAAGEIAEAIGRLDRSGVDVLLVIRGGGSLEDLWCFNELVVAEAIRACSVPVVSGVGHETDVTLADHVADHRAHTPTDAAQTVIPDRAQRVGEMERSFAYLSEAIERHLGDRAQRLARAAATRSLRRADTLVERRQERIEGLAQRLRSRSMHVLVVAGSALQASAGRLARQSPELRLERSEARTASAAARLRAAIQPSFEARRERLGLAERALEATSPFAVLARGYSITRRVGERTPLREAAALAPGERIETLLHRGRLVSEVSEASGPDEDRAQA